MHFYTKGNYYIKGWNKTLVGWLKESRLKIRGGEDQDLFASEEKLFLFITVSILAKIIEPGY